jgi:hypothetical protein
MEETMSKNIYSIGPDWYVASSADEAMKLAIEHYGDPECVEFEVAELLPDDMELTIIFQDMSDMFTVVPYALCRWERYGKYGLRVAAPNGAWASANDPGFLCSTEW